MKSAPAIVALMLGVGALCACASPTPVVTGLSPSTITSHLPAFELRVQGDSFDEGVTVILDGRSLVTSRVSDSELVCVVTPPDLGAAWTKSGVEEATLNVSVRKRDGGESSGLPLSVKGEHVFRLAGRVPVGSAYGFLKGPQAVVTPKATLYVQAQSTHPEGDNLLQLRGAHYGQEWGRLQRVFQFDGFLSSSGVNVDDSGALFQMVTNYEAERNVFIRSADDGLTWSTPVDIFTQEHILSATVATSGNRYHVFADLWGELYQRHSNDLGRTWSARERVPISGYEALRAVRSRDDRILLFWHERECRGSGHCIPSSTGIRHCVSEWGGLQWGPVRKGEFNAGWPWATGASVVVDSRNTVHVAMMGGGPDFFVSSSRDLGEHWSEGHVVRTGYPSGWGHSMVHQLMVDAADTLNLVYFIDDAIYLTRSIDGGATWSEPGRVVATKSDWAAAIDPEGYLHVVLLAGDSASTEIVQVPTEIVHLSSRMN